MSNKVYMYSGLFANSNGFRPDQFVDLASRISYLGREGPCFGAPGFCAANVRAWLHRQDTHVSTPPQRNKISTFQHPLAAPAMSNSNHRAPEFLSCDNTVRPEPLEDRPQR